MRVIGLTGNSGSGKGAVSEIMAELGALILDCDKIAHRNMEQGGAAYNEIAEAFPFAVSADGSIDRKKLGERVFSDAESLRLLNSITHKYIYEYIKKTLEEYSGDYAVIDAPLLIEAGMECICDEVWLVHADDKTRLERVIRRDGITAEEALMRFKNQTSYEELKKHADFLIENSEDLEGLKKQVYERVGK